jgi:hypothetical protein
MYYILMAKEAPEQIKKKEKILITRKILQEILKENPFISCILQRVWAEFLSLYLDYKIPYGIKLVLHPKNIKIDPKNQYILILYKGPPLLEPILPIESRLEFYRVI